MRRIRIWDISLEDDGTLDTCLSVVMRIQPDKYRFLFCMQDTSEFRDADGTLTSEGFDIIAEWAAEWADEMMADRRALGYSQIPI